MGARHGIHVKRRGVSGKMRMRDISDKAITEREAVVEGALSLKPSVIKLIKAKRVPKGDCLAAAEIAGILGAKKASQIIPLCHPIPIDFVGIEFVLGHRKIRIKTRVKTKAKTGVEMEALAATVVAALTIYDMCKPLDKNIVISDIKLLRKSGGKSGLYVR